MTCKVVRRWNAETRSGRVQHLIRVECSCGWATQGNNTFSAEHLEEWASKMIDWHLTMDPQGLKDHAS